MKRQGNRPDFGSCFAPKYPPEALTGSRKSLSDSGDDYRQKLVLRQLDSPMQTFWGITREDRHGFLAENPARIDSYIDVVHGASGHFFACRQSLLPSFQPRKFR